MELMEAVDIKTRIEHIIAILEIKYIDPERVFCFRSHKSKANARARIWSMPRIWQMALKIKSCYVVEVLSEKFDHISYDDQTKVLIHELLHIPKTFSGALRPHNGRYITVGHREVEKLYKLFKKNL